MSTFSTPKLLALTLLTGLLIGALTLGGQAVLPGILNQLANSAAVWSIIGFLLGSYARDWKTAALVGLIALSGEVAGYFAAALAIGVPESVDWILFWLVVALIARPIMGVAGHLAQHKHGILKWFATCALGAVFVAEGLYYYFALEYRETAVLWFGLAVALTLGYSLLFRRST